MGGTRPRPKFRRAAVPNASAAVLLSAAGTSVGLGTATVHVTSASGAFFVDNFETGAVGGGTLGAETPGVFSYQSGSGAFVSSVAPITGTYSLVNRYPATTLNTTSTAERRMWLGRDVGRLWLEFDWLVPTNFAHRANVVDGSEQVKFFQIWRDVYGSLNPGMQWGAEFWRVSDTESSFRPMASLPAWNNYVNGLESNGTFHFPTGSRFISPTGPVTPGVPVRLRFDLKPASSSVATDGHWRMWVNGQLYYSYENVNFYSKQVAPLVTPEVRRAYLMGWANGGFTEQTDFRTDNIGWYDTDPGWTPVVTASGLTAGLAAGTVTASVAGIWTDGPGANAPSWPGKTTYAIQQFATAIPVHYAAADANGYKGFSGFPGASGETWTPTRVSYPTVATPLGTQQVFQLQYPGQVETITANGQSTTVWRYAKNAYTNVAVNVTGTWDGTLSFETSTDGITWTAKSMWNDKASEQYSATSTSNNVGWWIADTLAERTAYDYFRVRATAWTSGTATVTVGMQGGQSPANASFGNLTGSPTRVYFRMGFKTPADWSDNGNSGTKLIFFSQITDSGQRTNHYIPMTGNGTNLIRPGVNLQSTGWGGSNNIDPSQTFNHGEWHDLEVILHAGTAGNADGIAQVWMDGIQVVNSSTVAFFGPLMTPRFTEFYFDPTFGGGTNPPINKFVQVAQFYYESAP